MNVKRKLLMGLLGFAGYAGCAQAQSPGPHLAPTHGTQARGSRIAPALPVHAHVPSLWQRVFGWKPVPRGMAVCKDSHSEPLCRVGLANGDFEDPNLSEALYGWHLLAGDYSPPPYLGSTPDSRVLAMPGQGALALTAAILPIDSTSSANPSHTYTVRLRARGSGALPAELAAHLAVSGSGDSGSTRELASTTRTVGWEWVDVEFKVDGIVHGEPAMLFVGVERMDNNTSTMLQIDDVRIERTPLGVSARSR